jgi:uncharacterized membrane protein required for colicin V production
MQLDIALLIIIAIFSILGFKNGFVHTLFSTFGWLIAIIVAFFTRDIVKGFIQDNTGLYDWHHERVYTICAKFTSGYTNNLTGGNVGDGVGDLTGGAVGDLTGGAIGDLTGGAVDDLTGGAVGDLTGGAVDGLTGGAVGELTGGAINSALEVVGGAVGAFGERITQMAADQLASASFSVLCFIGTVLLVKFIMFIITLAFSRKHNRGFVGALDATGGVLLGVAQGFIIVFIVLILILPVSLAVNPWLFEKISGMLNTSFFARTLFMMNPLIPFIEGLAPGLFDPYEWLSKAVNK